MIHVNEIICILHINFNVLDSILLVMYLLAFHYNSYCFAARVGCFYFVRLRIVVDIGSCVHILITLCVNYFCVGGLGD
jgi:hypothetical protein